MSDTIADAGKILKSTRESMGLSLSDVATATKISQRVLAALEDGKIDELPAKSFARGFARSYAQYLKIDPQPIIEAFQLDDRFITNQGRPEVDLSGNPVPAEPEKKSSSPGITIDWGSRAFLVVAILLLIALIIGVKSIVDKYAKERDVPAAVQTESGTAVITKPDAETAVPADTDPADTAAAVSPTAKATEVTPAAIPTTAITTSTPMATQAAVAAVKPSATSTPVPTSTVAPTATRAPTSTPVPTATATPTPSPTAKPSPTPKPTVAPTPTVAAVAATSPTQASTSPTPKPPGKVEEIILEALDRVEIEVVLDSGSKQKLVLEPGAIKAYKYSKTIEVDISNGGLINVIRNGQDMGNPGDLGRSVKLKYP